MRPGTLNEITDSQNNARTQPSSMLPPPTGLKRPTSQHGASNGNRSPTLAPHTTTNNCPEAATQPDAKQRKTLMERAAEYPEKHSFGVAPVTRSFNNKGVSLASQSGVSSFSTMAYRILLHILIYPASDMRTTIFGPGLPPIPKSPQSRSDLQHHRSTETSL